MMVKIRLAGVVAGAGRNKEEEALQYYVSLCHNNEFGSAVLDVAGYKLALRGKGDA